MHPWRHRAIGSGLILLFLFSGIAEARKRVLVKQTNFTACLSLIQTNTHPLRVNAPILQYTIAAFDPNWFNSNSSQQGAPLFTASLSPALTAYASRLALHVYVWMDTGVGQSGGHVPVVVFDRTTDSLNAALIGRSLTSNEIFALPFLPGGVNFDAGSPLYDLIVQQHQVPQMNVHIELSLLCGGAPVTEGGVAVGFKSNTQLRYVRTVQALSPGTDVANSKPVSIYTLNPLFQIVSDLFNDQDFKYPSDEPKMEVFMYEVRDGKNPQEVFKGMEFAKFAVDQQPMPYPVDLPPLGPGKVYAWRVRALLRGPESEYKYSNALYFKVDPRLDGGAGETPQGGLSEHKEFPQQVRYGEDYTKRVMASLKVILGPAFDALSLSHTDKIPAQGQIRINGSPCTLEDLERMAREFNKGRHTLTRLSFQ